MMLKLLNIQKYFSQMLLSSLINRKSGYNHTKGKSKNKKMKFKGKIIKTNKKLNKQYKFRK